MARSATKKPTRKKTPRKKADSSLKPKTDKRQPRSSFSFISPVRPAGVRVTEDTALTLGAVFACVRLISEDIAGMPWRVFERRGDGGNDPRPEDPADWLLQYQASPETPAFQFRETIVAHALMWGNGYAEIERDGAGRPAWLWTITPDRVWPVRAEDGRIVYEVTNPGGQPTYLEADDMFHLRGLGFDGLVGYSVVRLAARSIGVGIALDQATADFFANDSTPGGVLEHPGRIGKEARDRLREDYEKRHMGPGSRRRVAILEEGLKWSQTGLPPEDTKLIEQRGFTPADICRWFRVGPHKIADLTRATFSNIEHMGREHVTDALLPWIRRLETEANIKLFGRTNRGRRFTRINPKSLMRGDTQAQTAHLHTMLGDGVYDINEARDYLDLNPIPDGTKRFVQLNMQLLENAGEVDPATGLPPVNPPPDKSPPPASTADEEEPLRAARIEAKCMPLLEQACQRVQTRELRIVGKGKQVDEVDRRDYAAKQLSPVIEATAEMYGVQAGELTNLFLDSYAKWPGGSIPVREMAASLRELIQARAPK